MASMKAFADGFVLIGGFLAFAAFGYYAISKLEDFLKQIRVDGDYDQQEEQGELNIAAANLCAMQVGAIVLKDMKKEHPNLHCTLSVGEEPELLHALGAGNVDIVILYSKAARNKVVWQREVMLRAQPFINEDGMGIRPIQPVLQSQFVAWNHQDRRPFILEFVEKLCGQGA